VNEVVGRELRLNGLGPASDYFGAAFTASQADYAHILRHGVVFNHYLQPAGSNLVSECIGAGTRLLINRHPAFEEYLGASYPLFYATPDEADARLADACSARSADAVRQHLAAVRQSRSIGQFCRELARIGENAYERL